MNISLYKEYLSLLEYDKFPSFFKKYLEVPSLTRLKNIGYFCGMDYASKEVYSFSEKISRYDHSLTTALLTWKFTKDKKATLAGLFHDVATPCFSHVIDYMNKDYQKQESTEAYTEEIIKKDKKLRTYLKEDGISWKDIVHFKQYSIVDNDRPKLCADRLDGIILMSIAWTKRIKKEDIKEAVLDLAVFQNEDKEKELGFQTSKVAFKIVKYSKEIDQFCHTSEDNYMMELLASITRVAIEKKLVKYEELYEIDEVTLLNRIRNSKIEELTNLLQKFEMVKIKEIPFTEIKDIKVRKLDPLVGNIRSSMLFQKDRYSRRFCHMYHQYGWDHFSLIMGEAILHYFKEQKKRIRTHLDLGCGPGVLCDYFYQHHIKTTGVDISKEMIKLAQEKNDKIDFWVEDICHYHTEEKYDLITLTCDVVNHILDDKELERVFLNSYDMLNTDGYLIFDIYHQLHKNIVVDRGKGIKVYFSITGDGTIIRTNIKIKEENQDIYEGDVIERLYDISDIKQVLEKCHFTIVKIEDKVSDETQKFKDKLYVICKKEK